MVITRGIANQISQVACILLYLISIFNTSVIRNGDYSLTFQSSYYKCYPLLMLLLLLLSTHSSFGMHTGLLISRVGFRILSSMSQNLRTLNRSKSNPPTSVPFLVFIGFYVDIFQCNNFQKHNNFVISVNFKIKFNLKS